MLHRQPGRSETRITVRIDSFIPRDLTASCISDLYRARGGVQPTSRCGDPNVTRPPLTNTTITRIHDGQARGLEPKQAESEPSNQAQHPHHLGRRHRLVQRQRLQPRHHGVPHPEHRPHRAGRARCSPTGTGSRAAPPAAPPSSPASRPSAPGSPRWVCRAPTWASSPKTRPSPTCSSRWATPPASSARTTSATGTSSCPPPTASTSSSATSTT